MREVYEIPLSVPSNVFPREFELDLDGPLLEVVVKAVPTSVMGPDGKPQHALQFVLVVEGVEGAPPRSTKLLLSPPRVGIPEGYSYKQLLWLPDRYLLVYTMEVG